MNNNSNDITEYLKNISEGISQAEDSEFGLQSNVEIELAFVNKKSAEGGFHLLVADGKGKYKKEEISTMKLSWGRNVSNKHGNTIK